MVIVLLIAGIVLGIIGLAGGEMCAYGDEGKYTAMLGIGVLLAVGMIVFGCIHGFVSYPYSEGTHQGTLTAVDMEGYFFRRYKVYLKSSAYTEQGDETTYCVYLNETELANQLKDTIGKRVKLNYSHKGGYIGYNSCGTYHIDSVELLEGDTDGAK